MKYVLTEEGKRYLKEGLPELALLRLLREKSPLDIDEAKRSVPALGIAIQWAKAGGWIAIDGKTIRLLRYPEKIPEQIGLKEIEEGKIPKPDLLKQLLKRRLVVEMKEDIRTRAQKFVGKEIAEITPELISTGLWKQVKLKRYDVSAPAKRIWPGKRQPYAAFLREVKRKLLELGFSEMHGPMIEMEFWNFDALFQPQNHPARDWADTYSLAYPSVGQLPSQTIVKKVASAHENGWKYSWDPAKAARLMPRAHGTAVSARTLRHAKIPGKYFCISRCFRPDVLDASHLVEFNQIEGIILDESLTFRHLLGILKMFAMEIGGADEVSFLPDYYPFTEPSVQLSAKHPQLGWIELGGAGIFREEVTQPLGVKVPVIAWGIGIDRLAMLKLKINDIRQLFSQDLNWLRRTAVV